MFTGKVGENNINVLDALYTDEQLRKWSSKKIIKCPVCEGNLIYKHGVIKIQHLAHEVSECDIGYFENETKEHMQGKTILYNWLLKHNEMSNVHLEYWMPETKQRPDLYFEKDGVRYVIEFQCTPITVKEYRERHELYKLNNIIDIWVLGKENYDMYKNENVKADDINIISTTYRTKALERELMETQNKLYYLDVIHEVVYFIKNNRRAKEVVIFSYDYFILDINTCEFNSERYLFITQNMRDAELALQEQLIKDNLEKDRIYLIKTKLNSIIPNLFSKIQNNFTQCNLKLKSGSYKKYLWSISILKNGEYFYFFINHDSIDFCETYIYRKKGEKCQSSGFRKIDSFNYNNIYKEEIEAFIINKIERYIIN